MTQVAKMVFKIQININIVTGRPSISRTTPELYASIVTTVHLRIFDKFVPSYVFFFYNSFVCHLYVEFQLCTYVVLCIDVYPCIIVQCLKHIASIFMSLLECVLYYDAKLFVSMYIYTSVVIYSHLYFNYQLFDLILYWMSITYLFTMCPK